MDYDGCFQFLRLVTELPRHRIKRVLIALLFSNQLIFPKRSQNLIVQGPHEIGHRRATLRFHKCLDRHAPNKPYVAESLSWLYIGRSAGVL